MPERERMTATAVCASRWLTSSDLPLQGLTRAPAWQYDYEAGDASLAKFGCARSRRSRLTRIYCARAAHEARPEGEYVAEGQRPLFEERRRRGVLDASATLADRRPKLPALHLRRRRRAST